MFNDETGSQVYANDPTQSKTVEEIQRPLNEKATTIMAKQSR